MKICNESTTKATIASASTQPIKKRKYDAASARRTRMINKQRKLQGKPSLPRPRKTNRKYVYSGKYVTNVPGKIRKFKGVLGEKMRVYQNNLDVGKVSSVRYNMGCHAESSKEKSSAERAASDIHPSSARNTGYEI